MHHIPTPSLTSLPSRIAYLKAFLNFTPEDAASIHAAKPVVAPFIPTVLDAVYAKLLSFDVTAASFVAPRRDSDLNEGEGEDVERLTKSVEELTLESSQIRLRKGFLKNYLVELVTADYDSEKIWEDLNKVGMMQWDQEHDEQTEVESRVYPYWRLTRYVYRSTSPISEC